MCLRSMGYNIEVIAPDSENTMIKPHIIEHLKKNIRKLLHYLIMMKQVRMLWASMQVHIKSTDVFQLYVKTYQMLW